MHARGELESFTVNTYRYLMPLTKAARRRIKLDAMPYPKGRRGVQALPDYVPPVGQVVRGYALALLRDAPEAKDLAPYINKLGATGEDIMLALENQYIVNAMDTRGVDFDDMLDAIEAGACRLAVEDEQPSLFDAA